MINKRQQAQSLSPSFVPRLQAAAWALFSGQESGHMGPFLYQKAAWGADVRSDGLAHWARFLAENPAYTIPATTRRLIARFAEEGVAEAPCLVELGPGDAETVRTQTLPLLKAFAAERYLAIDGSAAAAENAARLVAQQGRPRGEARHGIRGEARRGIHGEARRGIHGEARQGWLDQLRDLPPRGVVLLFNVITNILDGSAEGLAAALRQFAAPLPAAWSLLMTTDGEEDPEKLYQSYHPRWIDAHSRSWLFAAANPLSPDEIEGLDPEAFRYDPTFDKANRVYEHGLRCLSAQTLKRDGQTLTLEAGARFIPLRSWKWPRETVAASAHAAGLKIEKHMTEGTVTAWLLRKGEE